MKELYAETYYIEDSRNNSEWDREPSLNKANTKAANEFFCDFYNLVRKFEDSFRYRGFQLDIFETDKSENIWTLAKEYAGCELPPSSAILKEIPFANMFSRIIYFGDNEAHSILANSFREKFCIDDKEEPFEIFEANTFDNHNSALWYIVEGLWILRFEKFSLIVSLGTDE
ncbi:hypothetical protein [Fibrobacter sp. UWEL]|uniref:hypothetical protein n=1 Tax=Fibrobacter sp. UWEL TaxID=1896209 RepID=UPI0009156909|nr:hypothetical protein [Fibrobacter sp. UWEL]SHL01706.1 hypothetical protein SAMN05720468_11192 [Fibrobacter sp. UWEL]